MTALADAFKIATAKKNLAGQGEASQRRTVMLDTKIMEREAAPVNGAIESAAAIQTERWFQAQISRARRLGAFTETVNLTVELAELLLANNPNNRKISVKVAQYARDISAGNWQHNGETIVIAETGELNDGQHRCAAVREAGRPIITEMTFGVSRESRSTIDTGLKRTVAQHLHMLGVSDSSNAAHAAELIIYHEATGKFSRPPYDRRVTPSEVIAWVQTNDITENLRVAYGLTKKLAGGAGIYAALHYRLGKIDSTEADAFFEDLKSGAALAANSPIYKLRELLIDKKNKKNGSMTDHDIGAVVILAWNAYRRKRGIRSLALKDGDEYPRPV